MKAKVKNKVIYYIIIILIIHHIIKLTYLLDLLRSNNTKLPIILKQGS